MELFILTIKLFYLLILIMGLAAAAKNRRKGEYSAADDGNIESRGQGSDEALLLAGKSLGVGVGICTLVATEVGGAFLNGTAEEVYKSGLLFCLAPIGYSLR